jgi:hypothetical protein
VPVSSKAKRAQSFGQVSIAPDMDTNWGNVKDAAPRRLCPMGAIASIWSSADRFRSSAGNGYGPTPHGGASPGCCQIVTRLPSKRVKEKPSKGSRRVMRSSRSMPIATSSPIAIEAEASERQ